MQLLVVSLLIQQPWKYLTPYHTEEYFTLIRQQAQEKLLLMEELLALFNNPENTLRESP